MILVVLVIVLLLLGGHADAAPAFSPPLPYYDWGACPFECCTYGEWTANGPTRVLRGRRRDARLAFELKQGEKVQGVTGVVVTTRAGLAKVFKRTKLGTQGLSIAPGGYLHSQLRRRRPLEVLVSGSGGYGPDTRYQ